MVGSRPDLLGGPAHCPNLAIAAALGAPRLFAFDDQNAQDPGVLLEHGVSFRVRGRMTA